MIIVDSAPSDAGEDEGRRKYLRRDTLAGYFFPDGEIRGTDSGGSLTGPSAMISPPGIYQGHRSPNRT